MSRLQNHNPVNMYKLAQALFYFNAAVWLTFGIISLVRLASRNDDQMITLLVVAILMFGNVFAMVLSGWLLGKQRLLFTLFALVVLVVNMVLTFTDQFGLFDFLTLVIDLILFGVLVKIALHQRVVKGM